MSIPLLEVVGITKNFPGVRALNNVSLSIYPGQVHALVGANGAGKSTLVKIIAGIMRPDSGVIRFQGNKTAIRNPAHARSISWRHLLLHYKALPRVLSQVPVA